MLVNLISRFINQKPQGRRKLNVGELYSRSENFRLKILKQYNTEKELAQALFSNITENEKKVLNFLIGSSLTMSVVYWSYEQIGNKVRVCSKTVQRMVKKLQDKGFVHVEYRFFDSNVYTPNRLFFRAPHMFKDVIPALKKILHVGLLIPLLTTTCQPPVLPFKRFYINNLFSSVSHSRARGFNPKTETAMSYKSDIIISPTLQEITNKLNLTKLGQCKLLIFTEKALSLAWSSVKLSPIDPSGTYDQTFNQLVNQAYIQSKRHDLDVSSSLLHILARKYNLDIEGKNIRTAVAPKREIPVPTPIDRPISLERYNNPESIAKREAFLRSFDADTRNAIEAKCKGIA